MAALEISDRAQSYGECEMSVWAQLFVFGVSISELWFSSAELLKTSPLQRRTQVALKLLSFLRVCFFTQFLCDLLPTPSGHIHRSAHPANREDRWMGATVAATTRQEMPLRFAIVSSAEVKGEVFGKACLLTGSRTQTASRPGAATQDETPLAGQHSEAVPDSLCGIPRSTGRKYLFPRRHSP